MGEQTHKQVTTTEQIKSYDSVHRPWGHSGGAEFPDLGVVTWLSGSPEELILERQREEQDESMPVSLHTWDEDGIPLQATELPNQTRVWGAVRDAG